MLTKLNGFTVIAQEHHTNGYVTVKVERPGDPMPYVVATWWQALGNQWSWGHYCHDENESFEVFREVATRNAARGSTDPERVIWE